jgi:DNA-binding transcriptional LysR family regulator
VLPCHKRRYRITAMRVTHTEDVSLSAWRTYLEVCRLGSLSAAAAELGYTQSAVSRQIATLERSAGTTLLERRPRGVVPTPAGEAFRHHARIVVNEAARALQSARDVPDRPVLPLAVGATPATAASIVPVALAGLEREVGRLPWTLLPALSAELQSMTAGGEIDLAVVTDAPPGLGDDPRLGRRLLGTDELCVMVPAGHRVAGRRRIAIGTLADEPWVEDNEGSAALLRTSAGRAGFDARIERTAADLMGKMALVAAGHAVALVPGVLAPSLRRDVVAVALEDPPRRGIYAIVRAGAEPHPVVEPLIDRMTAALREVSGSGGTSRSAAP